MSFFRRKIDPHTLTVRLAEAADQVSLGRMVHSASRRFLTTSVEETPHVFVTDPTAVLVMGNRLAAALTLGWRAAPVAWVRTLLIAEQIALDQALRMLSEPLFPLLRDEDISLVTITLDEWSEPWLRKPLEQNAYTPMVEVIGYEKSRFDRPTAGNQAATVRRAGRGDLATVMRLDAACFPLPWVKSAEVFGPALQSAACFLIAEFSGQPVGYAFATSHQGGHLVHLVRIAVLPAFQGSGVGARLLADVIDFCASRQVDTLTLNTQADNYAAQRLYERFGFRRTDDRQSVLGRRIDR